MSDSVKIVVGRQCDKIKQNTKKSQLGEVKKQLLSRGRQKGCNKREENVDIFSTGLRVAKVECKVEFGGNIETKTYCLRVAKVECKV